MINLILALSERKHMKEKYGSTIWGMFFHICVALVLLLQVQSEVCFGSSHCLVETTMRIYFHNSMCFCIVLFKTHCLGGCCGGTLTTSWTIWPFNSLFWFWVPFSVRFLLLLVHYDWALAPLVVDVNGDFTTADLDRIVVCHPLSLFSLYLVGLSMLLCVKDVHS